MCFQNTVCWKSIVDSNPRKHVCQSSKALFCYRGSFLFVCCCCCFFGGGLFVFLSSFFFYRKTTEITETPTNEMSYFVIGVYASLERSQSNVPLLAVKYRYRNHQTNVNEIVRSYQTLIRPLKLASMDSIKTRMPIKFTGKCKDVVFLNTMKI